MVIGAVAGFGAIVFYEALVVCTHFFLNVCAGYQVPTPAGEGGLAASASAARPWGAPAHCGFRCAPRCHPGFRVAPEAEGHGTDAAISAVHHNPRGVRFRAVIVKIVAWALTIGSVARVAEKAQPGRSAAGCGSLLARTFDLEPADGRIAVSTGMGRASGPSSALPWGGRPDRRRYLP